MTNELRGEERPDDVDADTCGLKEVKTGKIPDFYFGYPFPKIDPNDPNAACKMAWNFTA